jgi:hypothetical protein
MKQTIQNNIFKQIVEETAHCETHLTSKVGRHPVTHKWPNTCARGWVLNKQGIPANCKIIIEGKNYTIL